MADPIQLIDLPALGTIGGLTLATTAIVSGLHRAFNWSPAWLGLAVSLLLCLGATLFSAGASPQAWFLAVLNGFVVFFASAGASSAGGAIEQRAVNSSSGGAGTTESIGRRPWLRGWF